MADILIDLDDDVIEVLEAQARRLGITLNDRLLQIFKAGAERGSDLSAESERAEDNV